VPPLTPNVTLFPQFCQRASAYITLVHFRRSGNTVLLPAPIGNVGTGARTRGCASAGGKAGLRDKQAWLRWLLPSPTRGLQQASGLSQYIISTYQQKN